MTDHLERSRKRQKRSNSNACQDSSSEIHKQSEELFKCLQNTQYAWRDKYGRDDEFQIDPLNYKAEDEYLTALNKTKYAWRDKCDYDREFGISSYDYETEAEYNQALHDAKYSWRKSWRRTQRN